MKGRVQEHHPRFWLKIVFGKPSIVLPVPGGKGRWTTTLSYFPYTVSEGKETGLSTRNVIFFVTGIKFTYHPSTESSSTSSRGNRRWRSTRVKGKGPGLKSEVVLGAGPKTGNSPLHRVVVRPRSVTKLSVESPRCLTVLNGSVLLTLGSVDGLVGPET